MKVTTAWTFYDWANSAFALVITAAIFPSYFLKSTDELINIGNLTISNSSLYAYIIAIAYLVVAIMSPLMSGFADSANNKKVMMMFFCVLGSLSCMMLFFFQGHGHIDVRLSVFYSGYDRFYWKHCVLQRIFA